MLGILNVYSSKGINYGESLKIFYTHYRKCFKCHLYFWELVHARLRLTRCRWRMVAWVSSLSQQQVQYACNSKSLLSWQPKPQSHTKWSERKLGVDGVQRQRKYVLMKVKRRPTGTIVDKSRSKCSNVWTSLYATWPRCENLCSVKSHMHTPTKAWLLFLCLFLSYISLS